MLSSSVKRELVDEEPGDVDANVASAMERHVHQTNERLHCIKEALSTPMAYLGAARELLEWCGDPRAFQKAFESNLIGCLTVVSQVSQKPGYDLDLGYRILAVCAAQREKFTPKTASLLSVWCEELGRLLLLRHQRARQEDDGPPEHKPMLHKPPPTHNEPSPLWSGGGQQQLSVVTTVWGVSATTSTSSTTSYAPPNKPPFNTTQPQSRQQGQQPPGYSATSSPLSNNTPLGPGSNSNSNHPSANSTNEFQSSSSSAISAAALVAAAATATATATASVVALQEQRQQQQHQQHEVNQYNQGMSSQPFPPGYNSHHQRIPTNAPMSGGGGGPPPHMMNMPPMNNGMMGGGGSKMHHPSMYSGATPPQGGRTRYPSHQQQQPKRPQYNHMMPQQYGGPPPGMQCYSGQSYNGGQGCACCTQYPPQYGKQSQYNAPQYPSQQQMRSSLRPPYNSQPPPPPHYYHQGPPPQMNGQPPPSQYDPHYSPNQFNQMNMQRNMNMGQNYQLPIPGNPTPPLTPASVVPPYLSPTADIKPTFPETKTPLPPPKEDELRLTFPVRDGIILAPFRLEHNLAVSNHVFHLKPSVHQTLVWRTDLELQLKCFHHEDRQMNTNWPASVQVSVNATPLSIDRGDSKAAHRPLYLKEVCQPGRNTIQITVTACCCSHLFLLQLVHRPTVRSVLQGLLRKRLLPADHCVSKIKRNFSSAAASNSALGAEDGVEQTAIKVSLKCPITFKRITLPARGQECKHIQCFDLESYLQLNCERGAWRCPVCNKPALLEGLEVDQYIWGILTNLSNSEVEEVTIDNTASWKPVPVKATVKEESDGVETCSAPKRFKAMSPGSMTMPTTSAWEMGQGLSPYSNIPPPDMQSITNGPMLPNGSSSFGGNSSYEFQSQATDFSSPLSHLSDTVSSLDPLTAMEKSLNHHEQQMGLHDQPPTTPLRQPSVSTPSEPPGGLTSTPGTPSSSNMPHTPLTNPGGPPSVPPTEPTPGTSQPGSQASSDSHQPDLGELNFDPAAVIDGEGAGQEALNLLPESVVDPMELLSYLDPPELPGSLASVTSTSGGATSGGDDLLALFES